MDVYPNQLTNHLRSAVSYLNASPAEPNGNALLAIKKAEDEVARTLARVDAVLGKPWAEYREKVERVKVLLFRE